MLIAALADASPSIRITALRGLLNNRDNEKVMTALLTVVTNGDPDMRRCLFENLVNGNDDRTYEMIYTAMRDPDESIRRMAMQASQRIPREKNETACRNTRAHAEQR